MWGCTRCPSCPHFLCPKHAWRIRRFGVGRCSGTFCLSELLDMPLSLFFLFFLVSLTESARTRAIGTTRKDVSSRHITSFQDRTKRQFYVPTYYHYQPVYYVQTPIYYTYPSVLYAPCEYLLVSCRVLQTSQHTVAFTAVEPLLLFS